MDNTGKFKFSNYYIVIFIVVSADFVGFFGLWNRKLFKNCVFFIEKEFDPISSRCMGNFKNLTNLFEKSMLINYVSLHILKLIINLNESFVIIKITIF